MSESGQTRKSSVSLGMSGVGGVKQTSNSGRGRSAFSQYRSLDRSAATKDLRSCFRLHEQELGEVFASTQLNA